MIRVKTGREMTEVLKQASDAVQKDFVNMHKKLTFDAFYNLIRLTPVDTGFARSMWHVNVDSAPDEVVTAPKNAKDSKHFSSYSAPTIEFGDVVHIYNNVEYIGLLEHGSSAQSPQGMAEPTRVKIQAVADQVMGLLARKVLNV